jgi:parvulin-like peptidyl-prolyl isomerase
MMRKNVFWVISALLLMTGCPEKKTLTEKELAQIPLAQRTGLPEATGGFAMAVKGETITSDEVVAALEEPFKDLAQRSDYEQFKERARPAVERTLVNRITNILLYQEAKKQLGSDMDETLDKAAESEVKKFILGFEGDTAKAEEALKKMGMNWADFKDYQKKMILSQYYLSSKVPKERPITYSELADYYERAKDTFFVTPAMIEFRLIDIDVREMDVNDPNGNRLQKAGDLADSLIKRVRSGEDFGKLAKLYSNGYGKDAGGLWKPVEPDSLAGPYALLAVEAEKIKPGDIAGPIGVGDHIFIMRLESKRERSYEPLEKVRKELETQINLDRRREAIDKMGESLIQQAQIAEKDRFIDFCLEQIYRRNNSSK